MDAIPAWFPAHYDALHDFAGPVATIIAAGAAVFVTWRLGRGQLRVAKQQAAIARQQADTATLQADLANVRLQHDLYDRRYRLYEAARALLIKISRDATVDTEAIFEFAGGTGDAVFLLNAEVVAYFEEMRKKAIRLGFLKSTINLPQYADKRSAMIDEEGQIVLWFVDQFPLLADKFKPFLVLDKRNITPLPPSV
jgi:hypothetical protein